MPRWTYRPGDLTRCLLSKTVQHELRKVVMNDPRVVVLGPVQAGALHAPLIESFNRFRSRHYADSAAYLNSDAQESIESRLAIDERSLHFYAAREGELAATLRVTSHPFELSALTDELSSVSKEFDRFLELSRLFVDPTYQRAGIGKKVLYAAMLWANAREYLGFIAICREHRRKEFERFGLVPFEGRKMVIPSREHGEYRFMWGTWRMIIEGVAKTYAKKRIVKRLGQWLGPEEERKWKIPKHAFKISSAR